ncbi:DUF5670 family protein [Flavobacterium sp. H122]|uniref:DUF5670 family protein n=1 Tax=Flavobacterium sp. H122 TaxID=2529860 RepID=UPI00145A4A63|nr:DUF5670 family protein [Flavobacterium sp. H122]
MKKLYNSIAIALVVLWTIGLYVGEVGLLTHLLLIPVALILIYDIIDIAKLLNKG